MFCRNQLITKNTLVFFSFGVFFLEGGVASFFFFFIKNPFFEEKKKKKRVNTIGILQFNLNADIGLVSWIIILPSNNPLEEIAEVNREYLGKLLKTNAANNLGPCNI